MKRTVIYLLSIMMLCSCARELNPVEGSIAKGECYDLSINGSIDQVFSTRANDSGFCNGDAIGLYMVNYEDGSSNALGSVGNQADNVKFTFEEARNKWNSVSPVYYKDAKTHVDIYGYYPYAASVSDVSSYSFEVQQNQRIDGRNGGLGGYEASDFLWGKVKDVAPSSNVVDILFKHKMASVKVCLTKGNGWESDAEWASVSKDVLVANTVRKSRINLGDGSVKAVGETPETGIVPAENGADTWRAIVVPQEVPAGKVLLTITIDGQSRNLVKDASYTYYSGKMNIVTLAVNKEASSIGSGLRIVSEGIVAWENDGVSHDEVSREYVVIMCNEAGKLAEAIEAEGYDLTKIRNLKVEGQINASDLYTMRDRMTILQSLNLRDVRVMGVPELHYEPDIIQFNAFTGKKSLQRIIFPDTLKGIGYAAFSGTSLQGSLLFPEGLESIGMAAFSWVSSIDGTLQLPSTLKEIGDDAFMYTNLHGRLDLPENLISIGDRAFYGTRFSGNLLFPINLHHLGWGAFNGCSNLSGDLVIPDGIESIGSSTFTGCGFDGALTLGKNIKSIGTRAFGSCRFTGPLVLPQSLKVISNDAFGYCRFSSISFNEGLESLGEGAFSSNVNLTGEIVLPQALESINASLFDNCYNIDKIVIPKNVSYIGRMAFNGLYNLQSIVCEAIEVPEIVDAFYSVPKDNFAVEVPESSIKDYQNAPGWNEFKRIVAHRDFSISRRLLRTLSAGETRTFTLRAEPNAAWTVESKPDWVSVSPMSGTGKAEIEVTVSKLGEGGNNRDGDIVYKLAGKNYSTSTAVEQYAYQYGDGDVYVAQTHTKGNGVNLVFMADGYDARDISEGRYLSNALEAIDHYFAIEPYKTYREYFDVYVVFGCSADSGMGDINVIRESRFGSQYNGDSGIEPDFDVCFAYAAKAPVADLSKTLIIIVQNTNNYSGITYMYDDGAAISLCPLSTKEYPFDFRGLVQHEAGGHGFGKLGDEYIYKNKFIQGTPEYQNFVSAKENGWYDNLSLSGDLNKVPWSHLIYDDKYSDIVDVYEGGYFYARGIYRSEANSCMNNNVPYFSAVSREAIVKRILKYAGESYDYYSFREKDIADDSAASVPTKSSMPGYPPSCGNWGHHEPVMKGTSPNDESKR